MSTKSVANFDFFEEFDDILERIKIFSPEIVKGDSDIARALNVSRTTPSTWRRRGKLPLEAIVEYAKNKDVNIHWLLTGEGEPELSHMSTLDKGKLHDIAVSMYLGDPEAEKRVHELNIPISNRIREVSAYIHDNLTIDNEHDYQLAQTVLFKLAIKNQGTKKENIEELDKLIHFFNKQNKFNEFAMIPGYNVQVSAGHGSINNEEQPTRYLAFRYKWLKYRGFNEEDLAVVFAKGDSMEPTITNNNSLLIHTKIDTIQDGGIYVIRQDDTLLVKRIQRLLDGNLKLISDNSTYEPMILTKDSESLCIVGRVVWIAKDIG